jgi:NAD(P)-dependent dehydrogenase (short-subunit alcohol dehydrogenase family)
MTGLGGSVAVVTGGASGIGRAIALELARRGARIAILDHAPAEVVVSAVREFGADCVSVPTDITDYAAVVAASESIRAQLDEPDLLVNNAGGVAQAPLLEMSPDIWHQVVQLNLTAAFYTTRVFAPAMIRKGRGSIVNIASTSARFAWPRTAHYAAAKAGLIALTRATAFELGSYGVRANSVSPATVETPAWGGALGDPVFREHEEATTALKRLAQPEDVAKVVAFLLSSDAGYVTGEDVLCDGGYSTTGQTHGDRPLIRMTEPS